MRRFQLYLFCAKKIQTIARQKTRAEGSLAILILIRETAMRKLWLLMVVLVAGELRANEVEQQKDAIEFAEQQHLIVKSVAFWMMGQLQGWCSEEKASVLIDLVLQTRPEVILEIGVFGGKSLIPMAYAQHTLGIGKTYGIDPWEAAASIEGMQDPANIEWWKKLDHEFILRGLTEKIGAFHLENQVQLLKMTSAEAPVIQEIDILHIDGNHSEQTALFDVLKWVPCVKSGGLILFDDIGWFEGGINTTGAAVTWLNENCVKFVEFSDVAPWAIWIKP